MGRFINAIKSVRVNPCARSAVDTFIGAGTRAADSVRIARAKTTRAHSRVGLQAHVASVMRDAASIRAVERKNGILTFWALLISSALAVAGRQADGSVAQRSVRGRQSDVKTLLDASGAGFLAAFRSGPEGQVGAVVPWAPAPVGGKVVVIERAEFLPDLTLLGFFGFTLSFIIVDFTTGDTLFFGQPAALEYVCSLAYSEGFNLLGAGLCDRLRSETLVALAGVASRGEAEVRAKLATLTFNAWLKLAERTFRGEGM